MKKFSFITSLLMFFCFTTSIAFAGYDFPTHTSFNSDTSHIIYKDTAEDVYCVSVTPKTGSNSWTGFKTNGNDIYLKVYKEYTLVHSKLVDNVWSTVTTNNLGTNSGQTFTTNVTFIRTNVNIKDNSTGDIVFSPGDYVEEEEEETTPGGTGYPGMPDTEYAYTYPFVYVDHNGDAALALFSSDTVITFNATRDVKDIVINFTTQSPAKLSMYVLENDEWDSKGHNTFSSAGTYTATITMTNILSSPFVIYNGDGTIFFHLPLENLGATITGQMWTITIIAVSCLALLISLLVLLRVLRTYLV